MESVNTVYLPLGRSPLSQASSFLLSSTCSRAACSLCGRMESSSSSCEGGETQMSKQSKHGSPFQNHNMQ